MITETTGGKEPSKRVKKTEWQSTIPDEPGSFMLIHKDELFVDHTYQRAENKKRVWAIAKDWKWMAVGIICVVLRDDGHWYVFDGQHRVLAARSRPEIKELPCLVWNHESLRDEAKAFIDINTGRGPPNIVARMPALIASGDEAAIAVTRMVERAGKVIANGSTPRNVACPGLLMDLWKEDRETLERLWDNLLTPLCGEKKIIDSLIKAAFFIERRILGNESLTDKHWKDRLMKVGYLACLEGIRSYTVAKKNGNHKTCAEGLREAINYGLRNKLAVDLEWKPD